MTENLPNTDNAEIQAEACAWLAQLDADTMSPQDLEAFHEWLNRSPLHQREMRRAVGLWGDMNMLTELMAPIEAAHAQERKLIKRRQSWGFPKAVTAMAAACLMGIIIIGVAGPDRFAPPETEASILVTEVGEQLNSTLPDGSTIILNTNSQVEVDFDANVRKIRLLSGEAIFDVMPDKNRPLVVYAGDGLVRAVGTVFSVKLDDTTLNVAVSEGAVEVAPVRALQEVATQREIALGYVKAGHMAVFENQRTKIEPIPLAEIESSLSWQKGVLTFSGEPLEQVIAEVSRYTTLSITIGDPELTELRVGGVYPTDDTDALFEALEAGFDIHIEHTDPNNVVLMRVAQE